MINADKNRRPFWSLGVTPRQRLTISPSVDYAEQRKRCHYFVRGGRILWARDTRR
ncbi:MAG: DUF6527 family protein [Vitreimonas sp.]